MEAPNYLHFVATFEDGTQIIQTAEDKSAVAEDRNAFFDVLQKQLDTKLWCFVLAGEGYPTFGVDLRDGHFEVNGVPFFQHSDPIQNFKLHYFRNVKQHRTIEQGKQPVDSVELGYSLGWEAEYGGQTITRYMRVER